MKSDSFSSFPEKRTGPHAQSDPNLHGSDPFEEFRAGMDAVLAGELEVESAEQIVDPIIWQRLVDGRLTHDQYQDILMFAELRPELWRPCALAFLQEQALKTAISPFKKTAGQHSPQGNSQPAQDQTNPLDHQTNQPGKKISATRSAATATVKTIGIALSSLAAGFLLTFSVTHSLNDSHSGPLAGPIVATPVVAETNGFFQPKGCVKPIGTHISRRAITSGQFRERGLKFSSEVPRTPMEISAEFDENEWSATRRFYIFRDQDGSVYFQPIDRFEINPKNSH